MRTHPAPVRSPRTAASILALATVMVVGASPAEAQSFQGGGTYVTNPVAGGITTGAGTTNIALNPGQTIIDWSPTDTAVGNFGAINFQPTGTTATFSSTGDFAVLNRITPADSTRSIYMNGTIQGLIVGAAATTGGSVFFYSPSGLVIGADAVINVGSLLLSASPLQLDASNNFIDGTSVTFLPATAGRSITIVGPQGNSPGAQINASNYVAMVAPRVEHNGTITTAGQAALVGAEAAIINFSPDGLFDIQVTSGTSDGQGVSVSGTINGPAGNGPQGDRNRIYLVAVPKNQLMTMAISSGASLGFEIAGAADVDGNAIVLSAGKDVVDGQIQATRSAGGGTGDAGISMTNVTTTSALFSDATYNNIISATGTATMTGDVSIHSDRLARIYATTGGALTINGNVSVSGSESFAAGQTATSANAEIWGYGGDITINGNASVVSNATGAAQPGIGPVANVTGGSVTIQAGLGGSVQVNGDATLSSNAVGGSIAGAGGVAGNGTGGALTILAYDAGSAVTITGGVTSSTDGTGGSASGEGGTGGVGRGGFSSIGASSGSTIAINGGVDSSANGTGGNAFVDGCIACNGIGGTGIGGHIQVATTGAGNSVSIGDDTTLEAIGVGGDSDGTGGAGFGGGSQTSGTTGATVTFSASSSIVINGTLGLVATGAGGTGNNGNGGDGTGGRAASGSQSGATGGTLVVASDYSSDASGFGGGANGDGAGGIGRGGNSDNGGSAGFIDYQGNVAILIDGSGGYSELGAGGAGFGGSGWIDGFGADIHVGGNYSITGSARGGSGGTSGGAATSGDIYLTATNTASVVTVDGNVTLNSDAEGGDGFGGNGGSAQGIQSTIRATNGGTLTIAGSAFATSIAQGGDSYAPGGSAGAGNGGAVRYFSGVGGTLDITGPVTAFGDGIGGYADDPTGFSGSGVGGTASVRAITGGSTTIDGAVTLRADGSGGNAVECTTCGGRPGNGTGGFAQVLAQGAGSILTINNAVSVRANGYGSLGGATSFGNGTGGISRIAATDGGDTTITGNAQARADGFGGANNIGSEAGDGSGGNAQIFTQGTGASSVSITGTVMVTADGTGGIDATVGGEGGDGIGGVAGISAINGTIDVTGAAMVSATGNGAIGVYGIGGDGQGGVARATSENGALHLFSSLSVDGSATGGNGLVGGNATGVSTPPDAEIGAISALLFVDLGGSITVDGVTTMNSSATGGAASAGDGGSAIGGEADVAGFVGDITLNALSINAEARGGDGGNGGNGGDATAIGGDVTLGYTNQAIDGTITAGTVTISADAYGGAGGNGLGANSGANGGNGGDAISGAVIFSGSAAGGGLISGDATVTASAYGGAGGNGGDGDTGVGGNGGAGGSATAGFILTGTISNDPSPTAGGGVTYGNLDLQSLGQGGQGGSGGTAAGGNGIGGDGGDAVGGRTSFLLRGALGTVGDILLNSDAIGGDGGGGAIIGAGGDATTGIIAFESKDRFGHPDQPGTLVAGAVVGSAIATAGTGSSTGLETSQGGSYFRVSNGSATIDSFSFTIGAGTPAATADFIEVISGQAVINGPFSFVTTNNLSLFANSGSLTADQIVLDAANFVLAGIGEPPASPGTFAANGFDIATGADFVTSANIDSAGFLEIIAPGSITANNVVGGDAVYLTAQGGAISVNDIDAAGEIRLGAASTIAAGALTSAGSSVLINAGNDIAVGAIDSSDFVYLSSSGELSFTSIASGDSVGLNATGDITGGNIDALGEIGIYAQGSIDVGNANAGDYVDMFAEGNITTLDVTAGESIEIATYDPGNIEAPPIFGGFIHTGNLTAGDAIEVHAGTDVQLGNLSAGIVNPSIDEGADYTIGVIAGTTLVAGDINALVHSGLAAPGSIAVQDVTVGGIFMVLGGGAVSTGSIDAGTNLYIADYSMLELGGSFGNGGEFDPQPVLASTPVATGGSITIVGPASAAKVQAAAGGAISAGAISSDTSIRLEADGTIGTGALAAGTDVDLRAGGNIAIDGPSTVGGYFDIESFDGGISTQAVTAGDSIAIAAGNGNVATGNLTAGINGNIGTDGIGPAAIGDPYVAVYAANGSITTGDVAAPGDIILAASDNVGGGGLDSGSRVVVLAGGNIALGDISTPGEGQVQIGDFSMFELGGTPDDNFDIEPLFLATPTQTNGSVTLGAVTTGLLQVAAGGTLTTGAVTADTIWARAGGLATLNGIWSAPLVTLISGDIAIGQSGGIDAGAEGEVLLQAVAAGGAVIGDNVSGSGGYKLSNSEFAKVSGGNVTLLVGGYGGDANTVIGDLNVTGPLAGSNIESADGGLTIVTLEEGGEQVDGTLRIVGKITATGFGEDNYLAFATQNFELDAATGLIEITGSGGALSGYVGIAADRIHVANGALLDQLAANPQFSGYRQALNAPTATQRPEGVIRAAGIDIEFIDVGNAGPHSLLVQNTGTASTPAGFVVSSATIGDDSEGVAPGSIDMVINGQIVTPTGTLTGAAVRDLLVAEFGTEAFVAGSTINGCPLTGTCTTNNGGGGGGGGENLPPAVNLTPQTVSLLATDPLGEPAFGNEPDIDDGVPGDTSDLSSPISPPQPLFDTTPLDPSSDINDPVSGAGNPSLYSLHSDDEEDEDEDGDGRTEKVTKGGTK